jgi:AraC-like DNA-binding protein
VPQILQIAPACPALAPFVESLWYFTADFAHARERILPTGTMQLLVNLHEDELRSYHGEGLVHVQRIRGAAISGAYARSFGIDTDEQRHIAGVHFRPGGAFPFFAAPGDALRGDHVELDRLWGRDGALLRERLLEAPTPLAALRTLEALLLERLVRPLEVDKLVEFAVGALDRGASVGRVTARLGMTPRRFIRHFEGVVGLTPKRFARVRRFARVLDALEVGRPVDWSGLAVSCGYFDQAHLIHDFREFSGASPTHYRPRSEEGRYHALIDD